MAGMTTGAQPWVVEPPAGTPYHRLARTPAQRWWHGITGTLLIVAGSAQAELIAVLAALVTAYTVTGHEPNWASDSAPEALLADQTADLALSLAALAALIPITLCTAWLLQRRRPGTLSSVLGRLRWRWLLVTLGLATVAVLLGLAGSVLLDQLTDAPQDTAQETAEWVGWWRFTGPFLLIVLLVPLQAAGEEYVYRGWLVQTVAGYTLESRRSRLARELSVVLRTPWPAIGFSAVLFALSHGYTGWGVVDVLGFAVAAGWLAVRTGGLEASIALHTMNNVLAFTASAAVGDLETAQGSVPWQYVAADLTVITAYVAAVSWLARRRGVQRVTAQSSSGSVSSQSSIESGSQPGTPSTAR